MTANFDPQQLEQVAAANGHQPPARYGSDEAIARLVARMRYMMPGASTAPDMVIWRAAQLCALHQLDPFGSGDIYIWSPYGENATNPKDWIIHIGIAAWRRKALSQAKYNLSPRTMTAHEVAAARGALYDEADRGCEMTLFRLDVARECKDLGIPYTPVIAIGFWRKNAFLKKGGTIYVADSLAEGETAAQKAEKRAEAKCLRIAFSLAIPEDEEQVSDGQQWRVIDEMNAHAANEERARAPVHRPELNREPDGDLLWI